MSAFDCPGGYWSSTGDETTGQVSTCKPVGAGYRSPENDNLRHACPPGTFSDTDTATKCTACRPGRYTDHPRATECQPCPPKSYALHAGSETCESCNDLYYKGWASDYAIVLSAQQTGQPTEDLYCLEPLQGPVYPEPTPSPTVVPRPRLTETPTTRAHTTMHPTEVADTSSTTWKPTVVTEYPYDPSRVVPPVTEPTTWTTVEPTVLSPTVGGAAPGVLQDVPPSSTGQPPSWNVPSVTTHPWLPIVGGVSIAVAMGLAIIWSFTSSSNDSDWQEHDDDDDDNEEFSSAPHDDRECRSNEDNDSTCTLFVDEVTSSPNGWFEEVAAPPQPSSTVSGIWSMSVGFGFPQDEDNDSEESSSSTFSPEVLSL